MYLIPEQEWITDGEKHLYGKEAEQYLQARTHSLNWVCLSARQLIHNTEWELKQQEEAQDMIQ